jgi:adenine deaminase
MPHENINYLRSQTKRSEVVKALQQAKKADLILSGGRVVNVFTGEILDWDVVIYGDRIGFVGDANDFEAERRVDVSGQYLTPGLMDGHLHIDSCMVNATNFARGVLPLGTTSVFIDSHEIGNALGVDGVRMMVEEGRQTPLRVFQLVPAQVPAGPAEIQTPNTAIGVAETKELYALENVLGLGEVSKYRVVAGDPMFVDKIEWILHQGGYVDGSAHDFTGLNLQSYVASGIFADHESVTADFALERARMGLTVMIREGTTEHNLVKCIEAITKMGANPGCFCFCSDDRHPTEITAEGHINYMVSLAIREGVDPVTAVQMATINCARNFGADRDLGAIAPGKLADILVVPDMADFQPKMVWVGGQLVAREGETVVDLPQPSYPEAFLHSVEIDRQIRPEELVVRANGRQGEVTVHLIEAMEGRIWSGRSTETLPVTDGRVEPSPDQDVLKIVVVERYGKTPGPGIGVAFVRGFGLKSGALAQSVAQDIHDIVAVGANDADIAAAVNAVVDLNGGIVVVNNGQVLGQFALPIGGIMADSTVEEVSKAVGDLSAIAQQQMACKMGNPFACLQFQTHPMIPYLKISDKGLMDVNAQKLISVFAE